MDNDGEFFAHLVLVGTCAACGTEVQASYRQLKVPGVFGWICGSMTRSKLLDPPEAGVFVGRDGSTD